MIANLTLLETMFLRRMGYPFRTLVFLSQFGSSQVLIGQKIISVSQNEEMQLLLELVPLQQLYPGALQ